MPAPPSRAAIRPKRRGKVSLLLRARKYQGEAHYCVNLLQLDGSKPTIESGLLYGQLLKERVVLLAELLQLEVQWEEHPLGVSRDDPSMCVPK
jgi:hypothetical protein